MNPRKLRPITNLLILVVGLGVIAGPQAAARARPPRLAIAMPTTPASPQTPTISANDRSQALGPPPASAEQEREQFVKHVRASGPASGPWVDRAKQALLDDLKKARPKNASGIRWQEPECFRIGCLIDVVYPDIAAFNTFDQRMSDVETTAFASWSGGTYRSPPIDRPDRKVMATWGLARPAQQ